VSLERSQVLLLAIATGDFMTGLLTLTLTIKILGDKPLCGHVPNAFPPSAMQDYSLSRPTELDSGRVRLLVL